MEKHRNFLEWFARLSMFAIYFWFGLLKLLGLSPAGTLVMELQQKTLPFLGFEQFYMLFALFEMLIGVLFLVPKLTRLTVGLFAFHMLTTFMPVVFLPEVAWQKFMVPTLEGQYIIKNLALISVAMFLLAGNRGFREKENK